MCLENTEWLDLFPTINWTSAALEDRAGRVGWRYFVESLKNLNKIIGVISKEEPLKILKIEMIELQLYINII